MPKVSKRNSKRYFSQSKIKSHKNNWFQECRHLLNSLNNKEEQINRLNGLVFYYIIVIRRYFII